MNATPLKPTLKNGIYISDARSPILDFKVVGPFMLDDYRVALARLKKIVNTRTPPFGLLVDGRDARVLHIDAKTRREFVSAWEEDRELWLRTVAAEVRIVVNPLARGILTAFDWLTNRGKWPTKNVGEMAEAEAWLRERLAEANR